MKKWKSARSDVFRLGWKIAKNNSKPKPESLYSVLSVYYTCNVVKRLKLGWLYAPIPSACLLFTFRLSLAQHRVELSWFEGLFNNLWNKAKSSFNAKYAEEIYYTCCFCLWKCFSFPEQTGWGTEVAGNSWFDAILGKILGKIFVCFLI